MLPSVGREVVTEPAKANLERFLDQQDAHASGAADDEAEQRAVALLGEPGASGDVGLSAAALAHLDAGEPVAIVSDDRRIRTVARGLGARVTGTIGVVVRAVDEGLSVEEGKRLVERLDRHGLHMTAELREKAYELVEEAAG